MRESLFHLLRRLALAGVFLGACLMWTFAAFAQPVSQPVTQQTSRESTPLGKPATAQSAAPADANKPIIEPASMWRTAAALGAVLALILVLAFLAKKLAAKGSLPGALGSIGKAPAPSGVLEVLARYPVCAGTSLLLLKLDRRVLLISQSANKGLRSGATLNVLTELSEPEDVASILLKLRGEEQTRLAKKFESILSREEAITDQALAEVEPAQRTKHPAATLHVPADTRSGRDAAAAIKQRLSRAQSATTNRAIEVAGSAATSMRSTNDARAPEVAIPTSPRPTRATNLVATLALFLALAASLFTTSNALAQSRIGPPLPDITAQQPTTVPAVVTPRVITPARSLRDALDPSNATAQSPDITSLNPLEVLANAGNQLPGVNRSAVDAANSAAPGSTTRSNSGNGEGGGGGGLSTAINILVVLTIISLAPSIMLMTTCFVRIMIVLGLLRQALGTTSIPPPQVITAMALFMTLLVMSPTLDRINAEAIQPYRQGQITDYDALWNKAKQPMRDYMFAQIDASGNWNSLYMVLEYRGVDVSQPENLTRADVDMITLIPAYMLSELKIAFLMGFKLYLPFLVIDMVISTLLIAMGMMMLPPVLISLPFKLLLFVLVDGWTLVVGGLLTSFAQPEAVASLDPAQALEHLALHAPMLRDVLAASPAHLLALLGRPA
jgi:flagellar biosynthetic protein FliP